MTNESPDLFDHSEPPESAHEGTICLIKGNLKVYHKEKWHPLQASNSIIISKDQAQSILFLISIAESCIEATEYGGDYGDLSGEYDKLEWYLEKMLK